MHSFETIRNSTALKLAVNVPYSVYCFETIRNSTALKQTLDRAGFIVCFETIRNSTALKQALGYYAKTGVLKPFETAQL